MSSSDEELNDRVDGDLLDEMREANANDEMEPDENDGKSPQYIKNKKLRKINTNELIKNYYEGEDGEGEDFKSEGESSTSLNTVVHESPVKPTDDEYDGVQAFN